MLVSASFFKMKCLLYDLKNDNYEKLKKHFRHFHLIDKNNYFFKELFTQDFENTYSRLCVECNIDFSTCNQ